MDNTMRKEASNGGYKLQLSFFLGIECIKDSPTVTTIEEKNKTREIEPKMSLLLLLW